MTTTSASDPRPNREAPSRDVGRFAVFNGGDAGAAHVTAHEMLDEQRYEEGYRALRDWLDEHDGSGSDWIHLQWHMAVFEIATARVDDAVARFEEHIATAVPAREALTDAPSLLWRLSLSDASRQLDWSAVRRAALAGGEVGTEDPWVELHHLLALAGSGDRAALDARLDALMQDPGPCDTRTLLQLGWGLRTYASGHYEVAAKLLLASVERSATLGGSRAQNQLFSAIAERAQRLADESAQRRPAA